MHMSNSRTKYYNKHTLYVKSGVASEKQLYESLYGAIKDGEENLYKEDLKKFVNENEINISEDKSIVEQLMELGYKPPHKRSLKCKIKVNLIIKSNGDYYGYGYIYVAKEEVYWLLLGKNPDGTDRGVIEYLDPNWTPPSPKSVLTEEEKYERYSKMNWNEITEEEDRYIQPTIQKFLPPLMTIPGYEYDKVQYRHLQEMAKKEGKDPQKVPKIGYFELSQAYVHDVEPGKIPNVLFAKKVPDWIPVVAFKQIFKDYANDTIDVNLMEDEVFITFDKGSRDALFALLMTRKVHIIHPENPSLKCTLIFDHPFDKSVKSVKSGNKSSNKLDKPTNKLNNKNIDRDDVDISKYNYTKK